VTGRQTLSVAQLYALARRAGLPPDRAAVAAAVAMAESSGRSWVTSPNPDGGTNVGPWQLDTPGGKGAGYSVEQLQDPWVNAQVMAKGTNSGQDWSAWQTYAEGTYEQFLPGAKRVAGDEPAPSASSSSGGSWIDGVLHGLESPFKALESGGSSAASAAGSLLKLPSGVTGFFDSADKVAQGALWLLNPTNWARVMSGLLGFILLAAGLVYLAKAA
jgi:hypothetical protein